jgi:hypothetical protein
MGNNLTREWYSSSSAPAPSDYQRNQNGAVSGDGPKAIANLHHGTTHHYREREHQNQLGNLRR